jgi:dephospho-CoA kinase
MSRETMLFVGPSGAGKDTVVDRIALLTGAEVISLSDQVRGEADKAGLKNPNRDDLQVFANQMRSVHGNDVFARLASEKVTNNSKNGKGITVINGVRHPDEIAVFENPTIIGVNASPELRYKRILARSRSSDPSTWNEFMVCDKRENGTSDGKDGQQNYQCLAKTNIVIENQSNSFEQLDYMVDLLVDELVRVGHLKEFINILKVKDYSDTKSVIIVNGPHGAGKTTIGKMLSKSLSIPFATEVGRKLRDEVEYNVLQSSEDFDREVMRRELLRDHQLLRDKANQAFVIETWHAGNIAYALKRSPNIVQAYIGELKKQISKFNILHIMFSINDTTFFSRATEKVGLNQEKVLLDFYNEISKHTKRLYQSLGLQHQIIDNNGEKRKTFSQALSFAREHLG